MRTICIGCGHTIKNGIPEQYSSSGVCAICLENQIRAIQRRQGHFDCFGKATEVTLFASGDGRGLGARGLRGEENPYFPPR